MARRPERRLVACNSDAATKHVRTALQSRPLDKVRDRLEESGDPSAHAIAKGVYVLRKVLICAVVFVTVFAAFGQELWDLARTTIDGKNVAIEYGRPRLNGRNITDLMKQLPPDHVWRAGSGPMTLLMTEADLSIGGKKVPAGNYSLYMYCPEKGDYALLVNSDVGTQEAGPFPKAAPDRSNRTYPHFMDYTFAIGNKEVARIPLKRTAFERRWEVLTYSFEPAGKGALLTIRWGDQAWTVEFQPAG